VELMSDPRPPQNTTEAVSAVAGGVITALRSSPVMVLVLVLNMLMVSGAIYYLVRFEQFRHSEREQLYKILHACTTKTGELIQ
jgi:hypothetical protein